MPNEQLPEGEKTLAGRSAESQEDLVAVQGQVYRTRDDVKSAGEEIPEEIDGKAIALGVSSVLRGNKNLIATLDKVGLNAEETLREIAGLIEDKAALLNEQNTPENIREVKRITEILKSVFQRFYDLLRTEEREFHKRIEQRGLSGKEATQSNIDEIYSDPLEKEAIKTRRALQWLSNLFELAMAQVKQEKEVNPSTFFRCDPNNFWKLPWKEDNKPDQEILDDVFRKVFDRLKTIEDTAEINPELMQKIVELLETELQSTNYPVSQYSKEGSVLSGEKLALGKVMPLVRSTKVEQ